MKRYLVFAFDNHNAGGGWEDFECASDDLDDATAIANAAGNFAHVVDTETLSIVFATYPK